MVRAPVRLEQKTFSNSNDDLDEGEFSMKDEYSVFDCENIAESQQCSHRPSPRVAVGDFKSL